ncbi:MAG: M15 family metallopeptidase [Acidimicrobiia bacterium]
MSTIGPVPPDVVARSTWSTGCPVSLDDLSYLIVSHWGFDGDHHTGELIVHADHAESIVGVFSHLHDARFPIEQMRVVRADELDLPPTGDGNVTTAFVCRPVVGSTSWSMHAYGLAVDINPFHNPYVKDDLVLPELASYYTDRSLARPGMIVEGSVAVGAFDDIGWFWGGRWSTLDDPMHFSANNR